MPSNPDYPYADRYPVNRGLPEHGRPRADVLAELPGLTRETRLVNHSDFYDDRWAYGNRVPAIATASFNVTGAGSGPGL